MQKDADGFDKPKDGKVKILYKVLKHVDVGVSEGEIMGTGHIIKNYPLKLHSIKDI